jgi:hypothetical protein
MDPAQTLPGQPNSLLAIRAACAGQSASASIASLGRDDRRKILRSSAVLGLLMTPNKASALRVYARLQEREVLLFLASFKRARSQKDMKLLVQNHT